MPGSIFSTFFGVLLLFCCLCLSSGLLKVMEFGLSSCWIAGLIYWLEMLVLRRVCFFVGFWFVKLVRWDLLFGLFVGNFCFHLDCLQETFVSIWIGAFEPLGLLATSFGSSF